MTRNTNIPLILAVLTILGFGAGSMRWINMQFKAEDDVITALDKEHGQHIVDLQRQIDALRAAAQAMNISQPPRTRELVRDLMKKAALSEAKSDIRTPSYATRMSHYPSEDTGDAIQNFEDSKKVK